jgi:hypothetical protein
MGPDFPKIECDSLLVLRAAIELPLYGRRIERYRFAVRSVLIERMESFLRVMYGLASDGLTDQNSKPKSFEHSAIVLCMGDSTSLVFSP